MIGQTISHYRILAKIREDATGTVYKAADTEVDRFVAITEIAPGLTAAPERRERLEREALAASALRHPNIAQAYEFFNSGHIAYAVTEAPQGESLYDFLQTQRPRRRYLLRFAREIASALEAAHSVGIVHGPFDPAAIFISSNHRIKLHDFGFGVLEPAPGSEEARQSLFGRAAPYVSPEQAQGSPPDVRSDVFSFGALLYHMATGHRAFRANAVSETFKSVVHDEPKPVAQVTSRAPLGIDKLLEKCLRKDPQRRFQRIAEMRPALEKMVDAYFDNPKRRVSFFARKRGQIAKIAGIVLATTAVAATAALLWKREAAQEPLTGKQIRQITASNGGFDTDPAISRGGDWLAFASDRGGQGNLDIWIQPARGGEPRRLTHDPADDRDPSFSPDGATIAFHSARAGGGVYLLSTKGGDARLIAPGGRRPRFSPDGRWIAYWVGPPDLAPKADRAYKVFIIPAGGGAPRQIRPDFAAALYPIWSPDSKNLLFLGRADENRRDANAFEWWVAAIEGDQVRMTGACRSFRRAGALPDSQCGLPGDWKGSHIFFSNPSVEASAIWRAEISPENLKVSTRPVRITSGSGIETQPLAAGDHIVFSRRSYNADIWSVGLPSNPGKPAGALKRWTRDPGADESPSLSADGAKLLFQSNRTGHHNIWALDVKSGTESLVKASPQEQLWPLVAPDGTKVAFSELRIGRVEHFSQPISGGNKEVLCEQDCGPTVSGWSSAGDAVLIDSLYGVGPRVAVTLIKFPGREKNLLLADPQYDLNQARFSPDGRWIAFTGRQSGKVRLFVAPFRNAGPIPSREWTALTDGSAWDIGPQWSPGGKLVYFTSTRDGYRCVWGQRLDQSARPTGAAFAVAHFHAARLAPVLLPYDNMDLYVGRDQILVSLNEASGEIWSAKVSD